MGFLVYYGWRSISALVVGQLMVWYLDTSRPHDRLGLFMSLSAIAMAWGASLLVDWVQKRRRYHGLDMQAVVLAHLGIPILAMMPYAWARAQVYVKLGRIAESAFVPMFLHTWVNMVLAILAIGGLTLHVVQGDFSLLDLRRDVKGFFAGMLALGLMTLAFTGKFDLHLDPYLAIFLPFPLLAITAVWLAPAWTSAFGVLWCLLSVELSCLGYGPFALLGTVNTLNVTIELGIYNIVIVSVVYFLSKGSSRLTRQLNLNGIALSAAGIEPWEWDCYRGFSSLQGQPAGGFLQRVTTGLAGNAALRRLQGSESESTNIDENWRSKILRESSTDEIFGSAGQILQRGYDHQPTRAIGLLQNLTAEKKAEAALIELGQQKMQIRNLQAKLNPHFLFNSLNVIRALVHIDNDKADQAISTLSELLRGNLRTSNALFARLGEELVPVRAFLQLAHLRFGNRLKTQIQVPHDLFDVSVPPMMLLNLVENAITHGIGTLAKGGIVTIEASVSAEQVRISVRNTGTLSKNFEHGIGTEDAKQRLELLFGDQANFTLSQMNASTVAADLVFPVNHFLAHSIDPLHSSLS